MKLTKIDYSERIERKEQKERTFTANDISKHASIILMQDSFEFKTS